jgi:hypothetical protein
MVLAIAMVTVVATGLEAQATASPSSRVAPKAPARGIRTEPPPPDPSQPAPPAGAPSAPPAGTGTTIINNNYYTYGVGQPLAYTATEATYAQLAPPPAPIDVRGPQPAPATAYVPGHWVWTGSSYNWNEGRWVAIPAGYTRWVPGRWAQNQFGWYFLRGYWEP